MGKKTKKDKENKEKKLGPKATIYYDHPKRYGRWLELMKKRILDPKIEKSQEEKERFKKSAKKLNEMLFNDPRLEEMLGITREDIIEVIYIRRDLELLLELGALGYAYLAAKKIKDPKEQIGALTEVVNKYRELTGEELLDMEVLQELEKIKEREVRKERSPVVYGFIKDAVGEIKEEYDYLLKELNRVIARYSKKENRYIVEPKLEPDEIKELEKLVEILKGVDYEILKEHGIGLLYQNAGTWLAFYYAKTMNPDDKYFV